MLLRYFTFSFLDCASLQVVPITDDAFIYGNPPPRTGYLVRSLKHDLLSLISFLSVGVCS